MADQQWAVPGAEPPIEIGRSVQEAEVDIDMTPIIDVTFQLLIFFMFAATLVKSAAIELPPAKHGVGVDVQGATIITVGPPPAPGQPAPIYLGDTVDAPPVTLEEVERYVRENVAAGRTDVIVKAAANVPFRDVYEVERTVASVEGAKLHAAVREPYE